MNQEYYVGYNLTKKGYISRIWFFDKINNQLYHGAENTFFEKSSNDISFEYFKQSNEYIHSVNKEEFFNFIKKYNFLKIKKLKVNQILKRLQLIEYII